MRGQTAYFRRGLGVVVATGVLLVAAPAGASSRYVGNVGCGPSPPRHVCFGGDLVYGRFADLRHSYTAFTMCLRKPSGSTSCRHGRTRRAGQRSLSRITPGRVGSYRVTWYVHGHAVRAWNFRFEPEGV
jgi:hypothetical protein